MVVPTTKRQYYDTTKKVSAVAEYAGAVKSGVEAWGKLFDGQQKANMEALQIDVENDVKNEFARKSPEYDNDPDNAEFKQYMDDYRKQKYAEAREKVNPFYRGQFDTITRENDKRYNVAFDGWKLQQRQANASENVKTISQSMIDEAYLAGQTGNYDDARAQYNKKVATIREVSTSTLGARATEQGIADLNKQYLMSFAQGSIDANPFSMDEKLKDTKFVKEVGVENVQKIKNYAQGQQNKFKKQYTQKLISDFNANPTKEAFDLIKNQELIKVSDKTLSNMEEIYKASPNYICETEAEAEMSIAEKLANFSSNDYIKETGDEKGSFDYQKQFEDAAELTHYIMMQNSKDGKLSQKQMEEYMAQVAKTMSDDMVRRAMINTKGEVMDFLDNVWTHLDPFGSGLHGFVSNDMKRKVVSSGDKAVLDGIVRGTISEAMAKLALGDEDGAKKDFERGNRLILEWKTPEIRGKNVGDTFIKDGRVYEIKGFDSKDFSVKLL